MGIEAKPSNCAHLTTSIELTSFGRYIGGRQGKGAQWAARIGLGMVMEEAAKPRRPRLACCHTAAATRAHPKGKVLPHLLHPLLAACGHHAARHPNPCLATTRSIRGAGGCLCLCLQPPASHDEPFIACLLAYPGFFFSPMTDTGLTPVSKNAQTPQQPCRRRSTTPWWRSPRRTRAPTPGPTLARR